MIFLLLGLFIILIFGVIIVFSFPQFSPIPYFPTNKKDLHLVIEALNLKNDQIIYDLGAGDGEIIFEAARQSLEKNVNTEFVAVDINPVLCLIMWIRKAFHPNKKNIHIIWKDLFKTHFENEQKKYVTVFLYVSPWFIEKILSHVQKSIIIHSVVSYYYAVSSLRRRQKETKGIHSVFSYILT